MYYIETTFLFTNHSPNRPLFVKAKGTSHVPTCDK